MSTSDSADVRFESQHRAGHFYKNHCIYNDFISGPDVLDSKM